MLHEPIDRPRVESTFVQNRLNGEANAGPPTNFHDPLNDDNEFSFTGNDSLSPRKPKATSNNISNMNSFETYSSQASNYSHNTSQDKYSNNSNIANYSVSNRNRSDGAVGYVTSSNPLSNNNDIHNGFNNLGNTNNSSSSSNRYNSNSYGNYQQQGGGYGSLGSNPSQPTSNVSGLSSGSRFGRLAQFGMGLGSNNSSSSNNSFGNNDSYQQPSYNASNNPNTSITLARPTAGINFGRHRY